MPRSKTGAEQQEEQKERRRRWARCSEPHGDMTRLGYLMANLMRRVGRFVRVGTQLGVQGAYALKGVEVA